MTNAPSFSRYFEAWESIQVELQGKYSIQRLYRLHEYQTKRSFGHVLLILIITPLPTLAVVAIMDSVPMKPTSAGLDHSFMFWVRATILTWLTVVAIFEQFRRYVNGIPMSSSHVMLMGIIVAFGTTGIDYCLAMIIGYPLPFLAIVGAPGCLGLVVFCFAIGWGQYLRQNPKVAKETQQFAVVMNLTNSLLFVYTSFTYFFVKLSSSVQIIGLTLFFPALKIVYKNFWSRITKHLGDMRPEVVVFNMEIFHTLFVVCSLQQSTSMRTAIVLMIMDLLRLCFSIRRVSQRLQDLNEREARAGGNDMDKNQTLTSTSCCLPLFDTAIYILEQYPDFSSNNSNKLQRFWPQSTRIHIDTRSFIGKRMTKTHVIMPATLLPPQPTQHYHRSLGSLQSIIAISVSTTLTEDNKARVRAMTNQERARRIQTTLQLLYWIEFLLLVEFTEVIIPFIYSNALLIIFYLPNRAYYSQLQSLDEAKFTGTIQNILLYGFMELLSFLLLCVAVRRKLNVSPIHQLAFVLENQWQVVQVKLAAWFIVVLQNTVEHFGCDYTFQFKWLHGNQ